MVPVRKDRTPACGTSATERGRGRREHRNLQPATRVPPPARPARTSSHVTCHFVAMSKNPLQNFTAVPNSENRNPFPLPAPPPSRNPKSGIRDPTSAIPMSPTLANSVNLVNFKVSMFTCRRRQIRANYLKNRPRVRGEIFVETKPQINSSPVQGRHINSLE